MSISVRAFNIGLYTEHLEEASFLYDQMRALRGNPDIAWPSFEEFERRLEAHIDALVLGNALALDICRQRLTSGDAGEAFAAVCVICRHQDASEMARIWAALDYDDAERVTAVTEALKTELPPAWHAACEQSLLRGDERLVPILVTACGARRIPFADVIAQRLDANSGLISAGIIQALARLPLSETSLKLLEACMKHPSDAVKAAALRGLLGHGRRRPLQALYLVAQTEPWPQIALGLAGDRNAATLLRELLIAKRATLDTFDALAVLGDLSAVRSLCESLADEVLAAFAVQALYWITGAPLFEDVFVPETVDETTLFPKELTAWRESGERPKGVDDRPFGTTGCRLSRDPIVWTQWLNAHAGNFNAQFRYRRGQLYSARAVFECLCDPWTPHRLRRLAYDELLGRFGCPVSFEADWPVVQQRAALSAIERWLAENDANLPVGQW